MVDISEATLQQIMVILPRAFAISEALKTYQAQGNVLSADEKKMLATAEEIIARHEQLHRRNNGKTK